MSENLRLLGKYSAAMESGDGEAVYEFFSPDARSHASARSGTGPTCAAKSSCGGDTSDQRSPT